MIYLKLFLTFLMIGAFTFGGGYAMLPLIEQAVLENGWMTAEDIVDFIAVSESTPGPFAVNVSTYVGSEMGGIPGAFCATIGIVLPSFIIILIVAKIYERFKKSRAVTGVMAGLKPAVIGLIATAVITTAQAAFAITPVLSFIDLRFGIALLLFIGALAALLKKVNPIIIIVASAVFGIWVKTYIWVG